MRAGRRLLAKPEALAGGRAGGPLLSAGLALLRSPPPSCASPPQDPSGAAGLAMKEEMAKKIEKWQEPPPAKNVKVLPVPDAEVKKRRGGKRYRKMKVGGRVGWGLLGGGGGQAGPACASTGVCPDLRPACAPPLPPTPCHTPHPTL